MKSIKLILITILLTFSTNGYTIGGLDIPKLPVPGLGGGAVQADPELYL